MKLRYFRLRNLTRDLCNKIYFFTKVTVNTNKSSQKRYIDKIKSMISSERITGNHIGLKQIKK